MNTRERFIALQPQSAPGCAQAPVLLSLALFVSAITLLPGRTTVLQGVVHYIREHRPWSWRR